LGVTASSVRAQDTATTRLPNVGPVKPGDLLRIVVFQQKEMSGDFQIDSRGILQIPGLGDLPVGGMNPVQIKARLIQQLEKQGYSEPDLSLQPLIRVAVMGEVRTPGPQPIDPGTNLIQLLSIVGGPTERADLKKAHVLREGKSFPVDLGSAMNGSFTGRIVLFSNDVLVVPAKTGFFRSENFATIATVTGTLATLVNLVIILRTR
jgi:polysaccharide export outer membrane protein